MWFDVEAFDGSYLSALGPRENRLNVLMFFDRHFQSHAARSPTESIRLLPCEYLGVGYDVPQVFRGHGDTRPIVVPVAGYVSALEHD